MKSSNSTIQSLDRGLEIIEIVARAKKPVTIAELANDLNIDRSSAFRLVKTLQLRGLLMHPDGNKEYMLGITLWRLSQQYPWTELLVTKVSETIRQLAAETGETAHIAIRQGIKTVIIDNEMSEHPLGVSVQTGDEGLLHCTSVGKALIADYNRQDLEALLGKGPLKKMTSNTILDINDLAKECSKVRQTGYAVDDEEYFKSIRCVAAPVRDNSDTIVAAVGLSAPVNRLPRRKFEEFGRIVIESALQISNNLKN